MAHFLDEGARQFGMRSTTDRRSSMTKRIKAIAYEL